MNKQTFSKENATRNEFLAAGGQAALDANAIRTAEKCAAHSPLASSEARALVAKHGAGWSNDYRALVAYEVFHA